MTAIVRHKKSNALYRHIEGNKFRNIVTNVEGEVSDEIAQKIFSINSELTYFCNEYPLVEQLIKGLNLKIETNEQQ